MAAILLVTMTISRIEDQNFFLTRHQDSMQLSNFFLKKKEEFLQHPRQYFWKNTFSEPG